MRRIRLIGIGALAALSLSAASASTAGAATTLGSDLSQDPGITHSCGASEDMTLIQTVLPGRTLAAPSAGIITRWRIRWGELGPSSTGPLYDFQLNVVREQSTSWEIRATSDVMHQATVMGQNSATFESRIPIAAGDQVGLKLDRPDFTVNPGLSSGSASGKVALYCPPLAPGPAAMPDFTFDEELALNADIEPDADGDGFGDETQDQCPTDASTAGPCPQAAPPVATVTGRRAAALKKCKKKPKGPKRAKCTKRAKKLPV